MYITKYKRVTLKPFILSDAYKMIKWGNHDDLLFEEYNFPKFSDLELKNWYYSKTNNRNRKNFSIINENDNMIGYLTIRKIKKIRKKAIFGIVIDPKFINKGYGTESIKLFLKYYFDELKMRVLILQVAKFNKRAIKCYQKCGFEIINEYKNVFENQSIDISKYIENQNVKQYFKIYNRVIYTYYYDMKINKKHYKDIKF